MNEQVNEQMNELETIELQTQIEDAIRNEVAPYVESHSGKIKFEKLENGVVYVSMSGACEGCSAMSITLKAGVERMLRKKFVEVEKVLLAPAK